MENELKSTGQGENRWVEEIPDEQWGVYKQVMDEMQRRGLPFSLGGAFALAAYTQRWRNTKDLDLYILPENREKMIQVLSDLGMGDYFEVLPYERDWIYRAYQGDNIVDLIWAMPNERTQVDGEWLRSSPRIQVRGEDLPVLPAEELIWAKIYVLQKERSDWPDVFNILYGAGPNLDWERLVANLEQDAGLLGGLLSVFAWLAPNRALEFPNWIWARLNIGEPKGPVPMDVMRERACVLDSRPWFVPVIEGEN